MIIIMNKSKKFKLDGEYHMLLAKHAYDIPDDMISFALEHGREIKENRLEEMGIKIEQPRPGKQSNPKSKPKAKPAVKKAAAKGGKKNG